MDIEASVEQKSARLHLVVYGNEPFEEAKRRIAVEAEKTGVFDSVRLCSPADVSSEVKASELFKARRGAGYWIWKPDIILSTLDRVKDGEIVMYCDAGCRLYPSSEWRRIIRKLDGKDMLAFRMWHRTRPWTRRECLERFEDNPAGWENGFQYFATVVLFRKTGFSLSFVKEWLSEMLDHPDIVSDVPAENRFKQHPGFVENRHDQSVFSALVHKYAGKGRIALSWEHSDSLDPFSRQAIFNARMRKEPMVVPPLFQRIVYAISKRICFPLFSVLDRHFT